MKKFNALYSSHMFQHIDLPHLLEQRSEQLPIFISAFYFYSLLNIKITLKHSPGEVNFWISESMSVSGVWYCTIDIQDVTTKIGE